MPIAAYKVFIDRFVDAIREETARSSERAYESLAVKDMMTMFMLDNEAALTELVRVNNKK